MYKRQTQRDKALENMEVYAPIAHRLGIRAVKEELEDLSLRYLDPIAYQEIESGLALHRNEREAFIEETKAHIRERVSQLIPNVYLEGRVKSVNGIYRKMFIQGKNMDQIYDIYAVRVIEMCIRDRGIAVGNFLPEKDRVPYLDERLAGRAYVLLHGKHHLVRAGQNRRLHLSLSLIHI